MARLFLLDIKIMQYISCLSNKLKSEIVNEFRQSGASDEKVEDFVNNLPDCGEGAPVEIGEFKPKKGGGVKTKRAPSAYNQFISKCMKAADIKGTGKKASSVMKQCALEWKRSK